MGVSRLVSARSFLSALLIPFGLATAFPRISSAQYMFLDTDGDGSSTAADVLQPSGATAVDVWLRTDAGRDGAPATCSAGDLPFSILGYSFVLRAANGTVSFAGFVNRMGEFTTSSAGASSDTEYANGAVGGAPLAPGLYRLATVSVTPTGGTPAISIVANAALPGGYFTAFSSECFGLDLDGSLKLGSDWTDVDGIQYGGQVNRAPSIDPIADVTAAEGATATAPLRAVDLDGDPIAFSLVVGPSYASVVTVSPGTGIAEGRVDLTPGFDDAGDAAVSVSASDGLLTGGAAFSVHVENVNRAVTIGSVSDQVVREGETVATRVFADDPDHDEIAFGVASGPGFVSVDVLIARAPAVAEIRISPGFAAAGVHTVVMYATDGATRAETSFHIEVIDAYNYHPPILAALENAALAAGTVVERTLHGWSADGDAVTFTLASGPVFASVTTVSADPSAATGTLRLAPGPGDIGFYDVTVSASDGVRTDEQSMSVTVVPSGKPLPPGPDNFDTSYFSYETGEVPQALAVGDLDSDGNPDVGVGALDGTLTLHFGSTQGSMVRRQTYALGGAIYSVAIGDLNRDGVTDLAVADSVSDVVTILPGVGAGLFGGRVDVSCGDRAAQVALGDLNGDGNLDMVVANEGEASISVLLGHGDFTFEPQVKNAVGQDPCYSRVADFNRDGLPDVAVANEKSNSISILLGTGGGALAPHVEYRTALDPRSVAPGDLNEDGILDLAVPAFDANQISILIGRGDGTFGPHTDFDSGHCPWAITLADFNRDQHLDVATANVCTSDVSVFAGSGTGRFDTRSDYPGGSATRFLRSGDMNRDGRPDLAVCNEGAHTVDIFLGNGDGTLGGAAYVPVDSIGGGIVVADLNGDGSPDLGIPLLAGDIGLYFNRGDGTIATSARLPASDGPSAVLAGDWNEDGLIDLVVLGRGAGTLWYYAGTGPGMFGAATQIPLTASATVVTNADMNGDAHEDLIVGQTSPDAVTVLEGRGDGTFEPGTPLAVHGAPIRLTTGDWNADGAPDVAAVMSVEENPFTSYGEINVLLGDRTGGLAPGPRQVTTRFVTDVAFFDADQDGVVDLLATAIENLGDVFFVSANGYLMTLRDDGAGGFRAPEERFAGSSPLRLALRDVDGDGRDDIAISNGRPGAVSVMSGVEGGEFGARTAFGAGLLLDVSIADWDGDGDLDLLARSLDWVGVFRNRGYRGEPVLAARLFTTPDDKTVRLVGKKPMLCIQVEPMNGSFEVSDVDMGTVVLQSSGTGSVEEIPAIQGKTVGIGDRDRNGVNEIAACFDHDGLTALFEGVRGSVDVTATLSGRTYSGQRFSGHVSLKVVGAPHQALAVGVSPNPMNPVGTLTVVTAAVGPLHVTLHDLQGRLIGEITRQRSAPAGEYRFLLGSGSGSRRDLASGIYFYRVEAAGMVRTGKFTVLK